MFSHISPLQDIVRKTIRQELEGSERRFKRITMSDDSSDNPAELYGSDGTIYYRKAGGAGTEIGVSGAGGDVYLASDNIFTGDHQTIRGAGGSSANYPSLVMRNSTHAGVDYTALCLDDGGFFVIGMDGTNPKLGAALHANSLKITSLATPTADYDASTKKYVDDTAMPKSGGTFTSDIEMASGADIDSAAGTDLYLDPPDGQYVIIDGSGIIPLGDNLKTCGTASIRWSLVRGRASLSLHRYNQIPEVAHPHRQSR